MKWLKKIFEEDEYFEELKRDSGLYQKYFERLVEVSDNELWAKFLLKPNFALSDDCIAPIEEQEKKQEHVFKEAGDEGLNQIVLLVVYLQYATADPLFDQETKKSYWIDVIMGRQSTDSFPHHNAISHYLEKVGYIK